MALEDWAMSLHALERAVEMCLTPDEIAECLTDPEVVYPAGPEYGKHCSIHVHGRIAIAVDMEVKRAITVIWRGAVGRDFEDDMKRIRDVPPK